MRRRRKARASAECSRAPGSSGSSLAAVDVELGDERTALAAAPIEVTELTPTEGPQRDAAGASGDGSPALPALPTPTGPLPAPPLPMALLPGAPEPATGPQRDGGPGAGGGGVPACLGGAPA